ncbi:MAG: hypothetical protein ABSC10_13935 [Candidatus Acidiferrales bacterium]|jgi:hypothetical protein
MSLPMPAPKAVLRILINFCLVGWGAAIIAQASRMRPGYARLPWLHDLAIFFFFSLVAFALFFAEYQLVQGLTKHDLNVTLGYVQSLGCFLLVLSGLWGIYYASGPAAPSNPAFTENVLLVIYIFGHAVFLGNVVWSYVREGSAR